MPADELLTKEDFKREIGDYSETLIDRALARIEGRTGQSRQPVPAPHDARGRRYRRAWVDEVRQEIEAILNGK